MNRAALAALALAALAGRAGAEPIPQPRPVLTDARFLIADCEPFTLDRVHDGDTDVSVEFGRLREAEYEAPEVGHRAACDLEHKAGMAARLARSDLMAGADLCMVRTGRHSWGRPVVEVYANGARVAEILHMMGLVDPRPIDPVTGALAERPTWCQRSPRPARRPR